MTSRKAARAPHRSESSVHLRASSVPRSLPFVLFRDRNRRREVYAAPRNASGRSQPKPQKQLERVDVRTLRSIEISCRKISAGTRQKHGRFRANGPKFCPSLYEGSWLQPQSPDLVRSRAAVPTTRMVRALFTERLVCFVRRGHFTPEFPAEQAVPRGGSVPSVSLKASKIATVAGRRHVEHTPNNGHAFV